MKFYNDCNSNRTKLSGYDNFTFYCDGIALKRYASTFNSLIVERNQFTNFQYCSSGFTLLPSSPKMCDDCDKIRIPWLLQSSYLSYEDLRSYMYMNLKTPLYKNSIYQVSQKKWPDFTMSYLHEYWIWRLQIFYSNLAWVEIVYWKISWDYLTPLKFCWCLKISKFWAL